MIQNLPFAPFEECSLSITTAVPDKEGVYNVAVFLADCTRGKKSQIFIVFKYSTYLKKYFTIFLGSK